ANGTATIEIPTSLPIQAGDLVGIDLESGNHLESASVSGSAFSQWFPPLGDGSTSAPTSTTHNLELLFNADVQPPAGINSIRRNSGSVSGGTKVTIKGHDFSGTSVAFGNVPASSFTVDTDKQITAISPRSSKVGSVDIQVTTAAGTTPAAAADQ